MRILCLHLRYSVFSAFLLFLCACNSPPQQNIKKPVKDNTLISNVEEKPELNINDTKRLLTAQPLDIDTLMLHVETYIQSKRYIEAQALLVALAPYIPETYHAKAKTLATISGKLSGNKSFVNNEWLNEPLKEPDLEQARQQLLIENYKSEGELLEAVALQASISKDDPQSHHSIYEYLSQFQNAALPKIEQQYSSLRPHVALIQLIRSFALKPDELEQAISQFKHVYVGHPLVTPLPEGIDTITKLSFNNQQNVLVLLPLSGRFQSTGNAIKQGILAAYFDNKHTQETQISFVDTETQSDEQILEKIAQADWVIGPLLKETIDRLLPQIPTNTASLVLNRAETTNIDGDISQEEAGPPIFFGLAPEDEAEQIAEYVANNGFKRPIIVASSLGSSNRMLSAFITRWQTLKGAKSENQSVDVVTFDDIESLDKSLSSALGVAQSEQNAKQIDRMTNRIIFDQTRSRQDIDAIVVFASPEEMALINPMVEASISPFRQQTVPVFATSRAIETNATKNTLRDLENVHFVDAPLILRADKWPEISQMTIALWPEQSVRFQRFFAFGYDAFAMLPILPLITNLSPYQHSGLSGVLQMDKQHQIKRRMPMAKISQQTLTLIEE
jgi:outer membrane PBP1 activator LpoA protein